MALCDIHYIVYSGGAMNGLAYVGMQQLLEVAYPHLPEQVKGYAGVSVGALMALLMAIGYDAKALRAALESFDASVILGRGATFSRLGLLSAPATLGEWVGGLIAQHMGRADVNFAELYRRTRLHLTVVVTNLTQGRAEYWDRATQPAMPVRDAVVASMALPFVFMPVQGPGGDLFVDGALADGFPVAVFPPRHTMGVCLTMDHSPPYDTILDYGMALLELKVRLAGRNAPRVFPAELLCIPGAPSTGANFFLSPLHRQRLVCVGVVHTLLWMLTPYLVLFFWCSLHDVQLPSL